MSHMLLPEASLNAQNTTVEFRVRWFGILRVTGRLPGVSGVLRGVPGVDGQVAVSCTLEAGRVASGIALRDRHLRGPRFLNADLHPWIRFEGAVVQRTAGGLVIEGTLTLRGIASPVRFTCPMDAVEHTLDGARLRAEFTVSRSRHAVGVPPGVLRYNPLLMAIGDDVSVYVEVVVPIAVLEQVGYGARPRAATGQADST